MSHTTHATTGDRAAQPGAARYATRPFRWGDLDQLCDLMRRARLSAAPAAPGDLALELRLPRINATEDVFVAASAAEGGRLDAAVRIDLERNIKRSVATLYADPDIPEQNVVPPLLERAARRASQAGTSILHVPRPGWPGRPGRADPLLRRLGFAPAREYLHLRLRLSPEAGSDAALPPGYRLRPFVAGQDEAALADLQNAAFAGSWGYSPNSAAEIAARLSLPAWGPDGVLFACAKGSKSKPVAYVWTRLQRVAGASTGYICMTGVDPDHRRKGLGWAIVSAGVRLLAARGASVVLLEVDSRNRPARALYERLGFVPVASTTWHERKLTSPRGSRRR